MLLKNFFLFFFLFSSSVTFPINAKQPIAIEQNASPIEAPNILPEKPSDIGPTPLPSSTEMTHSYESAFMRMLVTLLGLVFLVFATFWILKRLGKGKFTMGGSGRLIRVIEKRALSPKSMLYIVEIGNKKVLLSESQLEVRALSSYEEITDNE